ncbi:MAG TPA: L-histidine N(alpha)-methyltransferase [Verrucomicrobiae bacterium]|nr:L-histidine N(alpha)-methyltransferase [Verrucomicrobiae bacterium]
MNSAGVVEPNWAASAPVIEAFRRDVLAGLSRPIKALPCKYLYDDEGARLFELICELDEYYPTRTELRILRENMHEIAACLGRAVNLVDLGSGSGAKARLLLKHLSQPTAYWPVDVASAQLVGCAAQAARDFPGLTVVPVCADFTQHFELPRRLPGSGQTVLFFPGSTIGNFEPPHAELFLRRLARVAGVNGGVLIGVDLKKSPAVFNPAYNDAQGVTARFNLNLLNRINRELQANFDLTQFRHQAFYNERPGRIEMHLVSRRPQAVAVEDCQFEFARGEPIVTEHSYKYELNEFRQLAARAGLELVRWWTDERRWFSVQFLKPHQTGIARDS